MKVGRQRRYITVHAVQQLRKGLESFPTEQRNKVSRCQATNVDEVDAKVDTAETQTGLMGKSALTPDVEEVTKKYGLEAGLWQVFKGNKGSMEADGTKPTQEAKSNKGDQA